MANASALVERRLGAWWDGKGVHFAVFSANAEKIELCLFDPEGAVQTNRIALARDPEAIWRVYIEGLRPGQLYGFRAYGPYEPRKGHRFNPNKLLLDPCAMELSGPIEYSDLSCGYVVGHPDADLTFDVRDSAPVIPKCRVIDRTFDWGDDRPPLVARADMVVYELHVRGMTISHPDVEPAKRGRFAGLASSAVIDHLRRLGVTTVELMPITPIVTQRPIAIGGLTDYWGYNPAIFSALEPRYGRGVVEFKAMVRALHAAGIQVIVDVVFTHSGEGSQLGSTLSFRGLDNASYYSLDSDDRSKYVDMTGCLNTIDCGQPQVIRLILDTLRYWMSEMHVDGFRFDLATTLARINGQFDPSASIFTAIRRDPMLAKAILIAEPWDIGVDGYQLGHFPDGWIEWNDRYRDSVRRFWRGNAGQLPVLATRLAGSSDLFSDRRGPLASLNYVTSHDGFTLEDLVSYTHKRNEMNLQGGADGQDENYSSNCGEEGPTATPVVRQLRDRRKRNMIATLMFSLGIPMLSAGDELGRTQSGNNNAYCQDNEISWLNWAKSAATGNSLLRFFECVIAARKAHPVLRRATHYAQAIEDGEVASDILWLTSKGRRMTEKEWLDPDLRCFCFVTGSPAPHAGRTDRVALLINGSHDASFFAVPSCPAGQRWECIIDTASDDARPTVAVHDAGSACRLEGESLMLLSVIEK